jgi:hypothetical protein
MHTWATAIHWSVSGDEWMGTRPNPTTLCFLLLWVLLELGEAELHRVRIIGAHHIQLGAAMGLNGELKGEILVEVHIQQAHPWIAIGVSSSERVGRRRQQFIFQLLGNWIQQ